LIGNTFTPLGERDLFAGMESTSLFFDAFGNVGGAARGISAGAGSLDAGFLFVVNPSGGLDAGVPRSATISRASSPASISTTAAFYGTSTGQLVKVLLSPDGGALLDGGVVLTRSGDLQSNAPVLGGGGLVYALGLGSDAGLTVRRQSDLSEVWSGDPFPPGTTSFGPPALDVLRTGTGTPNCSRPLGVLYVASVSGQVATLLAVLVDSPGLDPTAPWPKYQRDNGNTGNISLSTAPWTCP